MLQRKKLVLAVSLGLPLSLVSAHGELRAHAQDHPVFRAPCPRAEVRPDAPAPAPARSAAPAPAEPPMSAERRAAPSARAAEVTTAPPSMSAHDASTSTAAELAPPAPPNAESPAAPVAEDRDAPSSGAAELATAAPPSATVVAAPPSSARQDAPGGPQPAGEARPLVELASDATRAQPAPAPSDALRELDDVLSGEPGDPLARMESRQSPEPSAESPSPEETAAAIERVLPSVRACVGDGASGVVVLRLEFVSSGRASAVLVQSQSAHITHAQRACIARAARRAQVAAFQRSHFALSYPIRL